jgi:hypothetical protein
MVRSVQSVMVTGAAKWLDLVVMYGVVTRQGTRVYREYSQPVQNLFDQSA